MVALVSAVAWLAMVPPVLGLFKFLRTIRDQIDHLFLWLFLLCVYLIAYLRRTYADALREKRIVIFSERFVLYSAILVTVFFLYAHFASHIGWVNRERSVFWDILAEQFLQGRLYIPDPPYTHDLTMYEGNWYVPMPPLPGVLVMPFVYFLGVEDFDASYFSIFFSALNGILVYLILHELKARKWIELSQAGIFTLVGLFLFGTPHLWVGISGRGWFVSQIITVFFLALSIYSALRSRSPWVIGSFIGLAITARPNSLMTWPFVFAISMQLIKEKQGWVSLKEALSWSAKTALPILLAVATLFFYNYLRFDDFLDFGYANISGDPGIVTNVQTWGMFHPYFIRANLQAMLLEMPRFNPESRWLIEPSTVGMSIFLTTPALLYLFRFYPRDWWVIGAWVTVLFNVVLLSLYHNTGAHQFGYRYILDMQVPLFTMLAVGMKRKVPWHFVVLVLLSIAINLYGTNWFMNG